MRYFYTLINGWEDEGEITEISFEKFDKLLSDARDGFYKRILMYNKTPCEFVVHYSPPQEHNGVVFEESKTLVIAKKESV